MNNNSDTDFLVLACVALLKRKQIQKRQLPKHQWLQFQLFWQKMIFALMKDRDGLLF